MSNLRHAQRANADLRVSLRAHYDAITPPPANLTAIRSLIEDSYNSLKAKIDSLEHCERLIGGIDWAKFWALQNQVPPAGYSLTDIGNGLMSISLNAKDSESFLFVIFEHLTSCAKNISDVFAVLLNEMWTLGLAGSQIGLSNIVRQARRNNASHPLIVLIDPIFGDQNSWLNVASNVRNKSQHRDPTSILTIHLGRTSTDAPSLDSSLFPGGDTLSRRLDHYCPRLKDRAFQFIEDMNSVLSAHPTL